MAAGVSGAGQSSGAAPLPVELVEIVAGYAADSALNEEIAKVGQAVLANFPNEYRAAFGAVTEVAMLRKPTAEQLEKLREVYPNITEGGVEFGAASLEAETVRSMFQKNPPIQVILKNGERRTIMATSLVAGKLFGWAVEHIDWKKGRNTVQRRPEAFALADIHAVRKLAPDFEAWAAIQLKQK